MLSAFLLTYRLCTDFAKPNSNLILCTLQYLIRRFFRVYVVIALFTVAAVYGPHFFEGFQSEAYLGILPVLLLRYPGDTVTWTVSPEIRYYLVIPFICLLFHAMKKFQVFLFVAGITLTAYDQSFNMLGLTWHYGITNAHNQNYLLKKHFFVFFIGSLLAIGYFIVERTGSLMEHLKSFIVQLTMIVASLLLTSYTVYFHSGFFFGDLDYRYFLT